MRRWSDAYTAMLVVVPEPEQVVLCAQHVVCKIYACVHSNRTEYRDFGSNQNNTSGIACVLFPSEFPDRVSRHATPSGDASLATLAHDTAGGTRSRGRDRTGRGSDGAGRPGSAWREPRSSGPRPVKRAYQGKLRICATRASLHQKQINVHDSKMGSWRYTIQ